MITEPIQDEAIRILMIDDDPEWCNLIKSLSEGLNYKFSSVNNLIEAQNTLTHTDNIGEPFSVAAIDMYFSTSKTGIEAPRGKEIIRYVKKHHPHVACVVITGIDLSADNVLDLRDDYDLDYCLQKDRIDIDTFSKAITKAYNRVRSQKALNTPLAQLKNALERWRSIYANSEKNLAHAKQREALKGIDVDVATMNEIELYTTNIAESQKQMDKIQKEIDNFQS